MAKSVLERCNLEGTVEENLPMVAYAIAKAHEEFKDKTYELELSVISNKELTHTVLKRKDRESLQRDADSKVDEE